MLYSILRWLAGVALRWYYRDLEVSGADRFPARGPVLVAGNHPNALIDALVIARVVPRRLLLTAKATLFARPPLAWLLARAGVVPLRRSADEGGAADPGRNAGAFAAILDALDAGAAVLLFPEGRSHGEPQLSTLRTGLARIALEARDVRRLRGLSIVPVGLTFEAKSAPRSRVLVELGEPLSLEAWSAAGGGEVAALTREVDRRLRAVTLNFESAATRRRVLGLGEALAALLDEPRPVGRARPPLRLVAALARRIEAARQSVERGPAGGAAAPAPAPAAVRAVRFAERLEALDAAAAASGVALSEATIPVSAARGAWFALREAAIFMASAPLGAWGRVNHWVPFRAALAAGRRAETPEDPAMRTVIAGLGLVLAFYAAQAAAVAVAAGPLWAGAYALTLPFSAGWDLRFSDRRGDAVRRIRAYLALRRDPALRGRLAAEIAALREEAAALDVALP